MKNSSGDFILTGIKSEKGTNEKEGNIGPGTSNTGVIAEINKKPSK